MFRSVRPKAQQTKGAKDPVLKSIATIKHYEQNDFEMLSVNGRLPTFKKFLYDRSGEKCTSAKLATAGFCKHGKKDEPDAICLFCGKVMSFDPDDDPWEEHQSHCPQCPFVQIGKLDETTWTVDDTIHLLSALVTRSKKEATLQLTRELSSMIETMTQKLSL
ncbi:unnamed protein product, partial [Mesorhabditis belari]|uniref:Uncharacterized protein n=1 Tax=Mesorhabditis belari TaxID=2138241 RepID=A0AAF3EE78_9BILA